MVRSANCQCQWLRLPKNLTTLSKNSSILEVAAVAVKAVLVRAKLETTYMSDYRPNDLMYTGHETWKDSTSE